METEYEYGDDARVLATEPGGYARFYSPKWKVLHRFMNWVPEGQPVEFLYDTKKVWVWENLDVQDHPCVGVSFPMTSEDAVLWVDLSFTVGGWNAYMNLSWKGHRLDQWCSASDPVVCVHHGVFDILAAARARFGFPAVGFALDLVAQGWPLRESVPGSSWRRARAFPDTGMVQRWAQEPGMTNGELP